MSVEKRGAVASLRGRNHRRTEGGSPPAAQPEHKGVGQLVIERIFVPDVLTFRDGRIKLPADPNNMTATQ